jgi:putative sterol carrier protein
MSADNAIAQYFLETIPQQFNQALAEIPDLAYKPEFIAVFDVVGEGGGVYTIRADKGKIEVSPDAHPSPDLHTTISVADWQKAFGSSESLDPFIDYMRRDKVAVVKSLRGTADLELTRSDGSLWHSTIRFGNEEEPKITIMMTTDDYDAMMRGDLSGQMAFLSGKLKFDGSLPMLMKMGALSG